MRRNLDLIRQILLHIEAEGKARVWREAIQWPFDDLDEVSESLELLLEHGLLTSVQPVPDLEDHPVNYHRGLALTWTGHDFLDSVRDEKLWIEAKKGIDAAGGFTFDLLKALAKGLLKTKIQNHTGIELDFG
ncbi:MAG: DUF2513 domain-containing protein [Erythrobacter sp.]